MRNGKASAQAPTFPNERGGAMPWNSSYFPISMKSLQPDVRAKAIEIANALLDQGYGEGMAIRIAIAQAHRWAERHERHAVGSAAIRSPAHHRP
ncbi:DUF2188 domain-containing protein [Cupriavidus pinatubonensis]|uniref:Uncharacterized protein n=1 Tax=Cupriavidus pinatubonensis TaxID=248026 RepID=A0ABM8XZA8_9BURK|nr:hypothetical protein [Cupriavidus pinatubonensis]CAG9185655.1 hypothetical protein LMG23994_05832 [Cupriavidus pinatubonensis]